MTHSAAEAGKRPKGQTEHEDEQDGFTKVIHNEKFDRKDWCIAGETPVMEFREVIWHQVGWSIESLNTQGHKGTVTVTNFSFRWEDDGNHQSHETYPPLSLPLAAIHRSELDNGGNPVRWPSSMCGAQTMLTLFPKILRILKFLFKNQFDAESCSQLVNQNLPPFAFSHYRARMSNPTRVPEPLLPDNNRTSTSPCRAKKEAGPVDETVGTFTPPSSPDVPPGSCVGSPKPSSTDPEEITTAPPEWPYPYKYEVVKEFTRQGVTEDKDWQINTTLNSRYQVCRTYPSVVAIPKGSDSLAEESSKFRGKERFIALTWRDPKTGVAITRCSQPLPGMFGNRCERDERYMEKIRSASLPKGPRPRNGKDGKHRVSERLCLMDCRPKINAWANNLKGAGYETPANYKMADLEFCGIPNVHTMQKSLEDLQRLLTDRRKDDHAAYGDPDFLGLLSGTQWLEHILTLINLARKVVEKVTQGKPVCIHCSDGWDRTSQLSSLAQLMLDPFYRTCEGFITLIEKDWLSFGHKFDERSGISCSGIHPESQGDRSPIFFQWLCAVHTLQKEYRGHFQFNVTFLEKIAKASVSCQYGNFLGNCEHDRVNENRRSISLWDDMYGERENFLDPFYKFHPEPLVPYIGIDTMMTSSVWITDALIANRQRREELPEMILWKLLKEEREKNAQLSSRLVHEGCSPNVGEGLEGPREQGDQSGASPLQEEVQNGWCVVQNGSSGEGIPATSRGGIRGGRLTPPAPQPCPYPATGFNTNIVPTYFRECTPNGCAAQAEGSGGPNAAPRAAKAI